MILFFDTETTGLVNFSAPSSDPSQPRLVQIGMIACEDSGEEVFQMGAIIKPEGFDIPEKVAAIHGISQNKATLAGINLETVLTIFTYWMGRCELQVCHNFKFDKTVMESELLRIGFGYLETPYFCTMQEMTGVCRLRQATSQRFKWPKLQEAYQHVFGRKFDKAHDALADVRACKEIYFWLKMKENLKDYEGNRIDILDPAKSVPNPMYQTLPPDTLPVCNIDLIK